MLSLFYYIDEEVEGREFKTLAYSKDKAVWDLNLPSVLY